MRTIPVARRRALPRVDAPRPHAAPDPGATTRRAFLKYGLGGGAAIGLAGLGALRASADPPGADALRDRISPCFNGSPVGPPFSRPLVVPPPAPVSREGGVDVIHITERRGEAEIVPGVRTPIWGYEGITPGPTILARKGRQAFVTFTNGLPPGAEEEEYVNPNPQDPRTHPFIPESTVVHLHGINAAHGFDGYPEERRRPGESFTHQYPNNEYQRPATLWYHDHSVHITSDHVFRGLSGFYLLTDEVEDATGLPGTPAADPGRGYGVFDIPLVVKDVMIDPETGFLVYDNCSHFGAFGDVMTVNGRQQPRLDVAARKYRFRLLAGGDSRQWLLALRRAEVVGRDARDAVDEPFWLIGTDHGLLTGPAELTDRIHFATAERLEIVVDFSRYPIGTRLVMVNLLADPSDPKLFPIMAFDVTRAEPDPSRIPPGPLRPPEHPADTAPPVRRRTFAFNTQHGNFTINGRRWDPARVDAFPALDTNEEWTLVNTGGGWGHPVHIHLGRFRITDIDGRPPRPGELSGFKDVVWLGPNQTIRLVHQFWNFTGRYVFHCHNGSHEDHDMMSQFEVLPG